MVIGDDVSYLAFVARGSKIKSLQPAEYKAVNCPYSMRLCVELVPVTLNNWLMRSPTLLHQSRVQGIEDCTNPATNLLYTTPSAATKDQSLSQMLRALVTDVMKLLVPSGESCRYKIYGGQSIFP